MLRKLGRTLRRLFWQLGLGLAITLLAAFGYFLLAGLDTTAAFPSGAEAPPEPSFTLSAALPRSPLRWEEVPPCAGEASVVLNGNVPWLRAEDAPAESGVYLSELDALGRPGPALALLELSRMPEAERAPMGHIPLAGMLPYENEAASCMRRMGRRVLYRVTPLYVGNELLARGVQMEALSLEDGGRELQFNVFVYNVQPGISIDYATGDSRAD